MSDEIDDRLSRRFDDDQDDENETTSEQSQNDMNSSQSGAERKSQTSQKAQNIKKEWNVRSFYLDDGLDSDLTTAFKRLDLSLSEADAEVNLKKTRHFYPLIVELGLERLAGMDVTEVTERLEGEDSA
jgi:DNA polymerase elongation subunit (family B)